MSEDPRTTEHKHPMTICLDFDGVCNTYRGWKGKEVLFEPAEGLTEFLQELKNRRYEVVVHSTRPAAKLKAWFKKHGLLGLVDGFPQDKPPAVAYVDDRGIRFLGSFDSLLHSIDLHGTEPWWLKERGSR